MAKKMSYRELGMDVMERLYHERKEARQKAYAARRKKKVLLKGVSVKNFHAKQISDSFEQTPEHSVYNMC